jgi:competence protein ComEA
MLDSLFSKKEKIFIIVVILIFVSGATIRVLKSRHVLSTKSNIVEFNISSKNESIEHTLFTVQVEGLVVNPGIYELPAGSRIKDAIKSAGGVLPDAEPEALNLVLPVIDGMRIYVPEKGAPLDNPDRYIDIGLSSKNKSIVNSTYNPGDSSNKVDINSASVEELAGISGVGKVLANEIVKYRESVGGFRKIEDLKNVKGIGETKLDKIRQYITCK